MQRPIWRTSRRRRLSSARRGHGPPADARGRPPRLAGRSGCSFGSRRRASAVRRRKGRSSSSESAGVLGTAKSWVRSNRLGATKEAACTRAARRSCLPRDIVSATRGSFRSPGGRCLGSRRPVVGDCRRRAGQQGGVANANRRRRVHGGMCALRIRQSSFSQRVGTWRLVRPAPAPREVNPEQTGKAPRRGRVFRKLEDGATVYSTVFSSSNGRASFDAAREAFAMGPGSLSFPDF